MRRPVDEAAAQRHREDRALLMEKLASDPPSQVPHTVLAAYDDAPDYVVPGERVYFEVEVEPGISDVDLETLVRDYREAYNDIGQLTVKVREPPDPESGRTEGDVLAITRWDDDTGTDLLGIRGITVEP